MSADASIGNDRLWFVAHTRPRCEKKLARHCHREDCLATLPCYRSVKKYRGKTLTFEKPLFPGYLFLQLRPDQPRRVAQSDYVANLLTVVDQPLFARQLGDILTALETELEVCLAPHISAGKSARIKSGPLRGMEGIVERRSGKVTVLLRLDFISQAALVTIDATDLELLD